MPPAVPMLHLPEQHTEVRGAILDRVVRVLDHGQFINGPEVGELEDAIATAVGVSEAIGCASGTDALWLALRTLDMRPGDEVITTAFTFFATAGAIANAGGTPVFVDINPETWLIDPDAVEAALTPRTRAIVAVHLYGQMAPMAALRKVAARAGVPLVEDGAQSLGATQIQPDGRVAAAGSLGSFGTLSFFPSKPLGGWGDGGMVLTNDREQASRVRRLKAHGGAKQYHHEEVGVNSRLDTLQAAILLAKWTKFSSWQAEKAACAGRYSEWLSGVPGVRVPVVADGNTHAWHQYTLRCADAELRDRIKNALTANGVASMVYYPVPLHRQPCFSSSSSAILPFTEQASQEVLSLPMGPHLYSMEQERTVEIIRTVAEA